MNKIPSSSNSGESGFSRIMNKATAQNLRRESCHDDGTAQKKQRFVVRGSKGTTSSRDYLPRPNITFVTFSSSSLRTPSLSLSFSLSRAPALPCTPFGSSLLVGSTLESSCSEPGQILKSHGMACIEFNGGV